MYPRTMWVHAVRAWLDGEIGPDGVQLPLPGMPEPPETTAQRTWFLVVADYANPDGFLIAPRDHLERRWRIPARTAEKYWQKMRRAGWVRLVGKAGRGRSQVRQLTIPEWAVESLADPDPQLSTGPHLRSLGTPPGVGKEGLGTPQEQFGYAPQGPPEVVLRSNSQSSHGLALATLPQLPTHDLTDDDDEDQPPTPETWLASVARNTSLDITPNGYSRRIAAAAIAAGWTNPADALDALRDAGHNLARYDTGGGILTLMETKLPTLRKRPATPQWLLDIQGKRCPHPAGRALELLAIQCKTCRRDAGEPGHTA